VLPRLYRITFALGGLDASIGPKQVATIAEALVWTHALYLKDRPGVPPLAKLRTSGALAFSPAPLRAVPDGEIECLDVPSALKTGKADALTLAAFRAAELRVRSNVHAKVALLSRVETDGRFSLRPVVHLPPNAGGGFEDVAGGQGGFVVGEKPHPDRQRVCFVLDIFNPGERPMSHAILQCMLDALTDIDARYLRAHPEVPSIYASGVRYQEEPPGQEDWQDVATTMRLSVGDCDDISPWLTAELRARHGINARTMMKDTPRKNGSSLYHIQTLLPDGSIRDANVDLGMR
jgi:hypothetical protein